MEEPRPTYSALVDEERSFVAIHGIPSLVRNAESPRQKASGAIARLPVGTNMGVYGNNSRHSLCQLPTVARATGRSGSATGSPRPTPGGTRGATGGGAERLIDVL